MIWCLPKSVYCYGTSAINIRKEARKGQGNVWNQIAVVALIIRNSKSIKKSMRDRLEHPERPWGRRWVGAGLWALPCLSSFLPTTQGGLSGGTTLRVMGKRKREKIPASLNFIRLPYSNFLNYVFNCDDLLYIYLQQFNTAFDSNVG